MENLQEVQNVGKEFISFPKITLIKQIVQNVNHTAHYVGQDENDQPIYDHTILNPSLKFTGSVKLHGTNAGVCYSRAEGIWAQSRKNVITIEKDNAGFAMFVERNKEAFQELFNQLDEYIVDDNTIITIFGEWAGGNIQKGVAINGLEKFFAIFGVKISITKENRFWLTEDVYSKLKNHDARIFNTLDWETYEIEIDFNNVEKSIQKLIDITDAVEKQCPVGKWFGNEGVGEGVVWLHQSEKFGTIRFKVKGQKHSTSKVKKTVSLDPEVLKSIEEFLEYAVTENRLNQGIETVFTQNGEEMDIKKMGAFLKWVATDIFTEEKDAIVASGLEMKQLGKFISTKARTWFLKKWNTFN